MSMSDLRGKKIVIIGAGPTGIGQSGECDEGAVEACRALDALGCRLMVVNTNPDCVVNDGPWSAHTSIEPLTREGIEAIIDAQRPDAILPLFGGRRGLRLVSQLSADLAPGRERPEIWGASNQTLEAILNREILQSSLTPIGLATPPIFSIEGLDKATAKARELGFPVVVRCDDVRQLPDGALVYNQDELHATAAAFSGETKANFTLEASLADWQQVEIEILRDNRGRLCLMGSVEYMDTAVVHPGDAVGVCPAQTLSPSMQTGLADHAATIAEHLNIVGGATIRFAHHPAHSKPLVLAVHPRYTRASALIARVTGMPVARLCTLLAAGLSWDDLPRGLPRPENVPPNQKIVAVKYPVWDFEQLEGVADRLGRLNPKMQSVGQKMGCGTNFIEALQKAAGADSIEGQGLWGQAKRIPHNGLDDLLARLATPCSRRIEIILLALREQAASDAIIQKTNMAPWFVEQLKKVADLSLRLEAEKSERPSHDLLVRAKALGFSHHDLAELLNITARQLQRHLSRFDIQRAWATSPDELFGFSTFSQVKSPPPPAGDKKIVILGNGPHVIGNGGEQDYGIYHAAAAIKDLGYTPIIVNCNAAGAATGHATPARCYCEPLDAESLRAILDREQPDGVITQFAGHKVYAFSALLESSAIPLLGTPAAAISRLTERAGFRAQIKTLGIPQPMAMLVDSADAARQSANETGYPLSIHTPRQAARANPVMIDDQASLDRYLETTRVDSANKAWVEQFLPFAIEAQAEVLCDGQAARTIAVLEHIELAGVHAGDSACVLPPYSIAPRHMETIEAYCGKVALCLGILGLVNIRFAIYRDTVYLLEAGLGISRNLGFVTRCTGFPLAAAATRIVMGQSLDDLAIDVPTPRLVGVRAPVFPFNVFSHMDPLLGPRMRATGQVMATADDFGEAYFKALAAAATPLPTRGTVLITVTDEDKASILEPARIFHEHGFALMATRGTLEVLAKNGIEATLVRKLGFGRPNLVDEIKNGKVQLVINTPTVGQGQIDDSLIRKAAIAYGVANITTPASALAAARGIAAQRSLTRQPLV